MDSGGFSTQRRSNNYKNDHSSLMNVDGITKSRSQKKTSKKKKNTDGDKKKSAAEEARSINESLLRTKQMMHSELGRMSHVKDAIQSDENALKNIQEDQMGMGGAVKGAKGALGQMSRQDREEAVVLTISIIIFSLSALYVVWTRIRIPFLLW